MRKESRRRNSGGLDPLISPTMRIDYPILQAEIASPRDLEGVVLALWRMQCPSLAVGAASVSANASGIGTGSDLQCHLQYHRYHFRSSRRINQRIKQKMIRKDKRCHGLPNQVYQVSTRSDLRSNTPCPLPGPSPSECLLTYHLPEMTSLLPKPIFQQCACRI